VSDDLSPAEQKLANELSGLAVDPSPAAQEAIMRSVRTAVRSVKRRWRLGWRVTAAAVAAILILITGTVGVLAATSEALPHSPAYSLRLMGEQIRIAIASPVGREQLRIQFARDRFQQAGQVVQNNRSDARRLVDDGHSYLVQTQRDLPSLSAGEQGQVQNQLNQAGQDEQAAQNQLNQEGNQI
jgi:uncharacterized protein DUF5667